MLLFIFLFLPRAQSHCLQCSAVTDSDSAASSSFLLSMNLKKKKQMLDKGLELGIAADPRISSEGILSNIEDLNVKLSSYIDLVKDRI